ncbi:hypothetical protein MAR_004484 [Mya arenaria]|uniref:Uncharacterized protein n=1 Tax=Mya arenaria TaxID=6604 RepID=A0ABY7EZH6_MYAAR|nr:hypothetical protein MAR_004484 [Mya arenaria]
MNKKKGTKRTGADRKHWKEKKRQIGAAGKYLGADRKHWKEKKRQIGAAGKYLGRQGYVLEDE